MENTTTIQVLSEYGNSDQKALMLNLPEDLTNGLVISQDGMVDTKALITMLKTLCKEEKASKEANEKPVDVMKLIYGPAVQRKAC